MLLRTKLAADVGESDEVRLRFSEDILEVEAFSVRQ
jgi:hypothetical protein